MLKIAIYGSRRQAPYKEKIRALLRRLALSDVCILMDRKLYRHLADDLGMSLPGVCEAPEVYADMDGVDMVLSIGGDGTFLRTAAWVGRTGTPVLGINTGHLGYLAPLSIDDAPEYVDYIIAGDYNVEPRSLIAVEGIKTHGWPYALNEVVLSKDDSASMVSAVAKIDGIDLATYKADGLIIATPTGSTAYNLSAGGPIVQPSAPVVVLTPIAAHSLGMRPLVVNGDSCLTVRVEGRGHTFRLTLDGRTTVVPMGTELSLRRADFAVNVVQPHGAGFPNVLHDKLMFNA